MESHLLSERSRLKSVSSLTSNSCSDRSSSFPVFIIFLSMYSPAALPRFASAFTAEENDPFFKAASRKSS
jgi:hypothetical protein